METRIHKDLGLVEVLGKANENTRTMFKVKSIDRGDGWDENNQQYKGVKTKYSWSRSENKVYGEIFTVHKKDLS
jgi:hypothetical protein